MAAAFKEKAGGKFLCTMTTRFVSTYSNHLLPVLGYQCVIASDQICCWLSMFRSSLPANSRILIMSSVVQCLLALKVAVSVQQVRTVAVQHDG